MPYAKIIILASSPIGTDGKFLDFKDGMYLGGQVRMDAAVKVAEDNPGVELILVGGYNKPGRGDVPVSTQADDMFRFLSQRVPLANLRKIYSLPCTYHNFIAVFERWAAAHMANAEIGVLTNEYHIPRALEFASRAASKMDATNAINISPLSAERILDLDINTIVKGRLDEYRARLKSESRGLSQLRNNTYRETCPDYSVFKLRN